MEEYGCVHDRDLWQCLEDILRNDPDQCDPMARDSATVPLSVEGLGLRSAMRTSLSVHWAGWADCLPMIIQRHFAVAEHLIHKQEGHPVIPCFEAASPALRGLAGVRGFEPPSWRAVADRHSDQIPEKPRSTKLGAKRQGGSMKHLRVSRASFARNVFARMEDSD